ncbi:hypothetical protein PHISCL_11031, partial [Aspergillus sclerotialis]
PQQQARQLKTGPGSRATSRRPPRGRTAPSWTSTWRQAVHRVLRTRDHVQRSHQRRCRLRPSTLERHNRFASTYRPSDRPDGYLSNSGEEPMGS